MRDPDSADWSAPPGLTFRDWVRSGPAAAVPASGSDGAASGGRLRRPTPGDLEYHLSTLFPPVRPRGHFELRMIDAQPGDGWMVPLAVCSAILSDAEAGEAARAAVAPLWDGQPPGWPAPAAAGGRRRGARARHPGAGGDGPWLRAARLGPADPAIGRAGRECFAAARKALDRMAVPDGIAAAVDAFTDRYVSKDRCPADDLLEEIP